MLEACKDNVVVAVFEVNENAWKTCEICNIYWSKYYDKFHIESWLESYHNQAQDLLKKQDNLFIEVNDG